MPMKFRSIIFDLNNGETLSAFMRQQPQYPGGIADGLQFEVVTDRQLELGEVLKALGKIFVVKSIDKTEDNKFLMVIYGKDFNRDRDQSPEDATTQNQTTTGKIVS